MRFLKVEKCASTSSKVQAEKLFKKRRTARQWARDFPHLGQIVRQTSLLLV